MIENFNVDSIHDEKMKVIDNLVHSMNIGQSMDDVHLLNEDELKGYIKALTWVMENWK